MRECAVILIFILTACSVPPANSNQPVAPETRARHGLDDVPAADMAVVYKVATLDEWKNPFLVVRPDGVEMVTGRGSSGANTVSVDRMREILVSLPAEAWPLGRVVAVQELSIRSGRDDELIEGTGEALKRMLKELRVEINWWP